MHSSPAMPGSQFFSWYFSPVSTDFPKNFLPEHKASNQDAAYTDVLGASQQDIHSFATLAAKHRPWGNSSSWQFSSAELEVEAKKTALRNWTRKEIGLVSWLRRATLLRRRALFHSPRGNQIQGRLFWSFFQSCGSDIQMWVLPHLLKTCSTGYLES